MLHPFYVRDAIIAGSTGRIVMILLIYGGPFIGLPNIDIISILGSVATANKQAAVTLGGAIHFTMGIIFALIYALLWSLGIGSAIWWWGLTFGAIHGMLVVLLLILAARVYHPLSHIVSRPLMLVALLVNHIAYGLVVAVIYSAQR